MRFFLYMYRIIYSANGDRTRKSCKKRKVPGLAVALFANIVNILWKGFPTPNIRNIEYEYITLCFAQLRFGYLDPLKISSRINLLE